MPLTITRGTAGDSMDDALPVAKFQLRFLIQTIFFPSRFTSSGGRGAFAPAPKNPPQPACLRGRYRLNVHDKLAVPDPMRAGG